ncbi:MAG: hypothetical protein J6A51_03630 [Clostridia bacterium]|nr:hypothetical protein [Clostridia bacterium]
MKKILNLLKKKKTAIFTSIFAACFLVFYIVMIARPVNYSSKYVSDSGKTQMEYIFKNDETCRVKFNGKEPKIEENHFWFYVVDRGHIVIIDEPYTRSEWALERKFIIKTIQDLSYENLEKNALKINAFKFETSLQILKCQSTIIFAIVGGVLLALSLSLAGVSVYLFVKDLKNKPVEEKTKTTNEELSQDKIESIIKPSKKQAKTKEETTTSQKG